MKTFLVVLMLLFGLGDAHVLPWHVGGPRKARGIHRVKLGSAALALRGSGAGFLALVSDAQRCIHCKSGKYTPRIDPLTLTS